MATVLSLSVVMVILVLCIFIREQSDFKFLNIKHEEHINSDVMKRFNIHIPGHWRELKAGLCPKDILKDLLKLNIITKKRYDEVKHMETIGINKFILDKFTTEYLESRNGVVNGDVFSNLLKKQPKTVQDILLKEVVSPRWPKRDHDVCKTRLETANYMIDRIDLQGIMEELMECLIFNAKDYTKIIKSPLSEKTNCFLGSLISCLNKGSFECLLHYFERTSDPSFADLTETLIPAIYIKRQNHQGTGITEAERNIHVCRANLFIHIPEYNGLNIFTTEDIQRYSHWFIYEFGMYPTLGNVEENDTCNALISLESVCSDAFDRIQRSFKLEGFAELLERLMCIEKVVNILKTETVNVQMYLICEENKNIDHAIKDTPAIIDGVTILKTNRSYLIKEMEKAIFVERFKRYPEFQNINMSEQRQTINAYIVDTIIHHPQAYLKIFKRTIEENEQMCNICKRLDESRYVHEKTIATSTLRNNIIKNIINLQDILRDQDDLHNKLLDVNIFTEEKLNSFKTHSDIFNKTIIEILKSDRLAMLTFVDYIFQIGDIEMANALLADQPRPLHLRCQGKTGNSSMRFGRQNQSLIFLEEKFYIYKVKDVFCVEEMD